MNIFDLTDEEIEVGDRLSAGLLLHSTLGSAENLRIDLSFFTAADILVSAHNGNVVNSVFAQLSKIENIEVPVGAVRVGVAFEYTNSVDGDQICVSEWRMNKGVGLMPFTPQSTDGVGVCVEYSENGGFDSPAEYANFNGLKISDLPLATEPTLGIASKATDAELAAGTENTKFITSKQLVDHLGGGAGFDPTSDQTISGDWNYTGALTVDGDDVATQVWVNAQGFITSADGGDADTLDGIDSTDFARTDIAETFDLGVEVTGNLTEAGSRVWTAATLTNLNQLTNGPGFITSADGGDAGTLDGIDSTQFARTDIDETFDETVNVVGNLSEAGSRVWTAATLSNVSQLTNDSGYITSVVGQSYNDLDDLPVLFSGDYGDLANIPLTFAPSAHTHVLADITDLDVDDYVNMTDEQLAIGGNKAFTGTVTIEDLVVSNTLTTVNVETIAVGDSTISLNADFVAGAPLANAGVEVIRGDENTVHLLWNEATDKWIVTEDGVTDYDIIHRGIFDPASLHAVANSGDYNDLDNLPTAPVNNDFNFVGLSDSNNTVVNSGFLRWNALGTEIDYQATIATTDITGLSAVATSNDYDDLDNLPSLFDGAWNSLTGKPLFHVVATSGDYDDLDNKPVIPGNGAFTLAGLSDTTGAPEAQGYLRWNALADTVVYETTISTDDITGLSVVATSNDYADLDNKPVLPVNNDFDFVGLSDSNDAVVNDGFLRWNSAGTQIDYSATIAATDITGLDDVATSGDYNDLINLPAISTVGLSNDYNDLDNLPTAPVNNDFSFVGLSDSNNVVVNDGYLQWNATGTEVIYSATIPAASVSGLDDVATSGDYNDLSNLPVIPTAPVNNDFDFVGLSDSNDTVVNNGFLRWDATGTQVDYQATIAVGDIAGLSTVATSNDYDDLDNLPTLPVNVDFDFVGLSDSNNLVVNNGFLRWNATGTQVDYSATIATSDITGLSTVATSNDYDDLDNLPALFDGDYGSLSNIPTEFTPEAHTHTVSEITDFDPADYVTLATDQTIAGKKTFSDEVNVNADVFSNSKKLATEEFVLADSENGPFTYVTGGDIADVIATVVREGKKTMRFVAAGNYLFHIDPTTMNVGDSVEITKTEFAGSVGVDNTEGTIRVKTGTDEIGYVINDLAVGVITVTKVTAANLLMATFVQKGRNPDI